MSEAGAAGKIARHVARRIAMQDVLAPRRPIDGPTGEGGEPGDKRAGAFRTISEVAADLDVPQHVLRFWETRFGQIRPLKRAGGRRYYRPQDVDLVAGIRHLLHVRRYTIEGAQRVIRENGVRFVQAVGRGEAVAVAPALNDADVPSEGVRADRAALEAVLGDLYACRDALATLGVSPPEP